MKRLSVLVLGLLLCGCRHQMNNVDYWRSTQDPEKARAEFLLRTTGLVADEVTQYQVKIDEYVAQLKAQAKKEATDNRAYIKGFYAYTVKNVDGDSKGELIFTKNKKVVDVYTLSNGQVEKSGIDVDNVNIEDVVQFPVQESLIENVKYIKPSIQDINFEKEKIEALAMAYTSAGTLEYDFEKDNIVLPLTMFFKAEGNVAKLEDVLVAINMMSQKAKLPDDILQMLKNNSYVEKTKETDILKFTWSQTDKMYINYDTKEVFFVPIPRGVFYAVDKDNVLVADGTIYYSVIPSYYGPKQTDHEQIAVLKLRMFKNPNPDGTSTVKWRVDSVLR